MKAPVTVLFISALLIMWTVPAHALITPETPINAAVSQFAAGPGDIKDKDIDIHETITPEPSSGMLLAGGLIVMLRRRRLT